MKQANQEENSIEELMFADDLVLIAEDQITLQEMVSNLDQQCQKYGMRISRDKTEVMVTSREPIQYDIELDGETLRQVEQFEYLGSIFVREGGCKEDVKTRYLKAAEVFYQRSPILGHKGISMITKTHIIKAVFTPTLLYLSENWTLTSKERQMLTTTEIRCLRKAAGKTRMDNIGNEEIRRRVNMQPAEQTANKNKIRWWSHIKRMAPTAPLSKALVIQPEGRIPRGRSRNRWEDDVPRWYNEMGMPMTDVNNWVKERCPIVYPQEADGRRVRLKTNLIIIKNQISSYETHTNNTLWKGKFIIFITRLMEHIR